MLGTFRRLDVFGSEDTFCILSELQCLTSNSAVSQRTPSIAVHAEKTRAGIQKLLATRAASDRVLDYGGYETQKTAAQESNRWYQLKHSR
jgi:hypothetical protein